MYIWRFPLYCLPKIVKFYHNAVDIVPKGEPLNFLCFVIDDFFRFSVFFAFHELWEIGDFSQQYFSRLPSTLNFFLRTRLHPMNFLPFGSSISSQTSCFLIDSSSSFIPFGITIQVNYAYIKSVMIPKYGRRPPCSLAPTVLCFWKWFLKDFLFLLLFKLSIRSFLISLEFLGPCWVSWLSRSSIWYVGVNWSVSSRKKTSLLSINPLLEW